MSILDNNNPPLKNGIKTGPKGTSNSQTEIVKSDNNSSGTSQTFDFKIYEDKQHISNQLLYGVGFTGIDNKIINESTRNKYRVGGAFNLVGEAAMMISGHKAWQMGAVLAVRGGAKATASTLKDEGAGAAVTNFVIYSLPVTPMQAAYGHSPWKEPLKKLADKSANKIDNSILKFGEKMYKFAKTYTPSLGKVGTDIEVSLYQLNLTSQLEKTVFKQAYYKQPKKLFYSKDEAKVDDQGFVNTKTTTTYTNRNEVLQYELANINIANRNNGDLVTMANASFKKSVMSSPPPPAKKITTKTVRQITTADIKKGYVEGEQGGEIPAKAIVEAYLRLTVNPWIREWKRIQDPELDIAVTNAYLKEKKKDYVEKAAEFLVGGLANALADVFQPKITIREKQAEKVKQFLVALENAGGKWTIAGSVIKIDVPRANGLAKGTQGWREEIERTGDKQQRHELIQWYDDSRIGGRGTKSPTYIQWKRISTAVDGIEDNSKKGNAYAATSNKTQSQTNYVTTKYIPTYSPITFSNLSNTKQISRTTKK